MEFKTINVQLAFDILAREGRPESDSWRPTDLRTDRLSTIRYISYGDVPLPTPLRMIDLRIDRKDGFVSMFSTLISRDHRCFRDISTVLQKRLKEINLRFEPTSPDGLGYILDAHNDLIYTFAERGDPSLVRIISAGDYGSKPIQFKDNEEDGAPNRDFLHHVKEIETLMGIYVESIMSYKEIATNQTMPKTIYLNF